MILEGVYIMHISYAVASAIVLQALCRHVDQKLELELELELTKDFVHQPPIKS